MFSTLNKDLNASTKNGSAIIKLKAIIIEHTFHLVVLIRLSSFFRKKVPLIGKPIALIIQYIIRVLYASDIDSNANIGEGLAIMHGHDIVIGSDVIIGKNCKIFNGVTLGNKNTETDVIEQPIVGNNVVISTGAKVLGKVTIGDNAIVGANSVVTKSVEAFTVVAGVPARVINRHN